MRLYFHTSDRLIRLLSSGLAALLVACAQSGEDDDFELPPPQPVDGAVSSDTPEATLAGLEILGRGGNAVDAAVAVSLVLGVTQPFESGLGGSVVMLWVPAGGEGVVIRGGEEPAGASGATLRPDALRVLYHAWRRYGSGNVTWDVLVGPAIRAAAKGYQLGHFSHRTLVQEYDRVIADPAATRLLLAPDRSIPAEASRLANPDLAVVLEQVATRGPEAFYGGAVGQRIAATLASKNLRMTPAEFAATPAATEMRALRGRYRGFTVWSAPDPYGGRYLLEGLRFLELAPSNWLESPGWGRSAWLAEGLVFAWAGGGVHPVEHLARLAPMPAPYGATPPAAMAGESTPAVDTVQRAEGRGKPIRTAPASVAGNRRPLDATPRATTHFSIVDGDGNAVAVTQTLGSSFGSGPVEGLGFFYQEPHTGHAAPLVPTVVTDSVRVRLVLGSPGGERGVGAVVQVMLQVLDFGKTLEEAVAAPRLHVIPASADGRSRLFLESVMWEDTLSVRHAAYAKWGDSIDTRARARGFEVGEQQRGPMNEGLDPWFGAVNAVHWTGSAWDAVGDGRRDAIGGVLVKGAPNLQRTDRGVTSPRPAEGG